MSLREPALFQLIIVTGTSGAGKTMALRHLEDMGYFCADNLIPALINSFVELICTQFNKVALGVDLRGGNFFHSLSGCLHMLKEKGFAYKVVFLEAADEVLVARFSETRRRHPMQKEELSLLESIQEEKIHLSDIREQADIILNTSQMRAVELKQTISQRVVGEVESQIGLVLTVISFGYRYGLPMDADLVFDVRFLPNPFYIDDMRPLTGLDELVSEYVLDKPATRQFIKKFFSFISYLVPNYRREGKSNLTIAVGCTGGRHRSVAISRRLAQELREQNYYVLEKFRDIHKDEWRYRAKKDLVEKTPYNLNVAALGGGTGLSTLLRGLKQFYDHITAIVTVSDDGGSSGRLRKELGILPPGDIRNCIKALANEELLLTELFNFRFKDGQGELGGHSFGNLFLSAMAEIVGDFNQAVQESSKVLAIRGQVLPVSLDNIVLEATMEDGRVIEGESSITEYGGHIRSIRILGEGFHPLPEAVEKIREADAIILGPGSLFTSLIPHLLFPEIREAIIKNPGPKIFICNIMTQPGETSGYDVSAHIDALYQHMGRSDWLTHVLVNTNTPTVLRQKYEEMGSTPIRYDMTHLPGSKTKLIFVDLLSENGFVRHDPDKVGRCVFELLKDRYFPEPLPR